MTAYLGPHLASVPVKNNEICFLLWHVTTNAVTLDFVVQPGEHGGFRLVATQTAPRKGCQVVLAGVNVVAGRTCHFRYLEAPAFFQ
jgi:hypothetical protein